MEQNNYIAKLLKAIFLMVVSIGFFLIAYINSGGHTADAFSLILMYAGLILFGIGAVWGFLLLLDKK